MLYKQIAASSSTAAQVGSKKNNDEWAQAAIGGHHGNTSLAEPVQNTYKPWFVNTNLGLVTKVEQLVWQAVGPAVRLPALRVSAALSTMVDPLLCSTESNRDSESYWYSVLILLGRVRFLRRPWL